MELVKKIEREINCVVKFVGKREKVWYFFIIKNGQRKFPSRFYQLIIFWKLWERERESKWFYIYIYKKAQSENFNQFLSINCVLNIVRKRESKWYFFIHKKYPNWKFHPILPISCVLKIVKNRSNDTFLLQKRCPNENFIQFFSN